MKVKNTYPPASKKGKVDLSTVIKWAKWPFIIAVIATPVINLILGGQAWSLVALWGLFMLWSFTISPQLVEYNRLSNVAKLVTYSAILLVIIKYTIAPTMDISVIVLVGAGGLVLLGILFFSNLRRQKQNVFPLLLFIVMSVILGVVAIIIWRGKTSWPYIVFASIAIGFLLTIAIVLREDLLNEIKKRFHTK